MSPFLFRTSVRLRGFMRSLLTRTEGVAAVEFALIVPILVTMFIGTVELSQAVTANRRVTQVGSSTGDLVARSTQPLIDADVLDIMKIGGFLLTPFPSTALTVDIRVVGSSPTDATATKVYWMCSYNGTNPNNVSCTCPKSPYSIPAGLVAKGDYVVISDVKYGYKPAVYDVFLKQYFGGSGGIYQMKETVYLKPRSLAPQLTTGGTTCGLTG